MLTTPCFLTHALDDLELLLREDPPGRDAGAPRNDPDARRLDRCRLLVFLGLDERARESLGALDASQAVGEHAQQQLLRAVLDFQSGDHDGTRRFLLDAMSRAVDDDPTARLALADFLVATDSFERAQALLERPCAGIAEAYRGLLRGRLAGARPDGGALLGIDRLLSGLEVLGGGDFPELEWELRFALGELLHADGQNTAAKEQAEHARQLVLALAERLPAPHRETFLADPRRLRIFQEPAARAPLPRRSPGTDRFAAPGDPAGMRLLEGEIMALERERSMLWRLVNVNQRLAGEYDLPRLLTRIVEGAVEISGAQRGYILLADDQAGSLRVAAGTDEQQEFSTSVARRVLETGRALCTVDAGRDESLEQSGSVVDLRLLSLLCVPLTPAPGLPARGAGPLGVVYLDNRGRAGVFTEDDLRFIEAFAVQASLALAGARRFEENVQARENLQNQNREITRQGTHLRANLRDKEEKLVATQKMLRRRERELGLIARQEGIIGQSAPMRRVTALIARVADSRVPVFIHGESGTGKALVARCVHFAGPTRNGELVSLNCAAMPEGLLESELFGHCRGAFTGADRDKTGLFELASSGTLFLDEIGDMPLAMQAKLLKALEDGEIRPVGAERTVRVDPRIVTATHQDLETLVAAGAFREDLYYRVNVARIELPPLRERAEDVPLLLEHFLEEAAKAGSRRRAPRRLSPDAMEVVCRHHWPGNVRELRNFAERITLMADGPEISRGLVLSQLAAFRAVAAGPGEPDAPRAYHSARDEFERTLVQAALDRNSGNVSAAARELAIQRKQLYRILDRLGMRR